MGSGIRQRARWLAPALAGIALAIIVTVLGHAPSQAAQTPLSISIVGNHFVNGAGQTIRLVGVNTPSAEYTCVQGNGYDDGHFTDADAAAIASWHATAVRVPLNEDCWLGINGQPDKSQDPSLTAAGYQQEIESYVQALNAHGLYAILDLHWSAPGAQVADSQQPMPDAHSTDFWTSVASTPAIKNNPAIVFDLFNEPFDPTDPKSGDDPNPDHKVSWQCWENGGGVCETQSYKNQGATLGSVYPVVGMQTLLNAVRNAGATQPVMTGGLDYANDLSQWADNAPDDPLNQEAASFHNYMGKACDNQTCWDNTIAPLTQNVPVVTGEFDEDNFTEAKCPTKTDSGFDNTYLNWADQHGVGYLAWGWWVLSQQEKDDAGCSAFYLIDDYNGTPAAPNGTVLHDHLTALASTSTTSTTSTTKSTTTSSTTTTTSSTTTTPGGGGGGGGGGKPPVTLTTFSAHVQSGGSTVGFVLRAAHDCTGTLTGQTVNTYAVTSAKRKRHKVSLGTAHFTLKAGKSKTVVLRLSKGSKKLLARKHSLKVRIAITLTGANSARTISHRTVTLKAPAKKHKHRA